MNSSLRHNHRPRHRFTLIELLVGMAILSILMLMMFQFLISSQRTLEHSDSIWEIYENSRIVFDLIERDLQGAVVSSVPSQTIGMYIGEPEATDQSRDLIVCFVSSTEPPEAGSMKPTSRLCEITYKHHSDSVTMNPDVEPYILHRQIVSDVDSLNWNFLGANTVSGDPDNDNNWYMNGTNEQGSGEFDFEKVVEGVNFFSMVFYDSYDNPITAGSHITTPPVRVVVNLELFDASLIDAPEDVRERTMRSFTKIFFLAHTED